MKKYQEIQEYILNNIKSGRLEPKSMIETETELCQKFSTSRMTVRRALADLISKGILYTVQGKGTFVNEHKNFKQFYKLTGFAEEAAALGLKASSIIIGLQKGLPDKSVASIMNIDSKKSVTNLARLRLVDNEILAFEDVHLLTSVVGEITEEEAGGSLFEYLEKKRNVKISHATQNLTAVAADKKLSHLLRVEEGTPLLKMTMIGYTVDDTIYEYGHTYYRCDKYTFSQTSYRAPKA